MRPSRKHVLGLGGVILGVGLAWWGFHRPSNGRDWVTECAVLPSAEIDGDRILVRNVRNNVYQSADVFRPVYEDRTYDLGKVESLWFAIVPFHDWWQGPAHVMLSFGFEGGEFLAVSVEARRRKGKGYSSLKGLLRQYELMYVLADERDVINLRSRYRGDEVSLYPVRMEKADLRLLFLDVLHRANALKDRPEFYNTLFNSCASNVLRHANAVRIRRIPWWHVRALLPGYSDRLAYDLGLIDSDLPLEEMRRRFHVSGVISADKDFSLRIREGVHSQNRPLSRSRFQGNLEPGPVSTGRAKRVPSWHSAPSPTREEEKKG